MREIDPSGEIGCSLTKSTKNISRPLTDIGVPACTYFRDRRELQLIAPAIDVREQPACSLRKRNDRYVCRLPIRASNKKTPFAKSRGRLFFPTRRSGPMHCGGGGITRRGRLGNRIRLILFRNPIDHDLRVVAFTATSAKK